MTPHRIAAGAALAILALTAPARASEDAGFCAPGSPAVAVDMASRTTDAFLDRMREIGVSTIIRYYDQPDETIPGKTLHAQERRNIAAHGLSLLVVFQHWNQKPEKFSAKTGEEDARRALALARENRQPRGSAIYFGVDYHAVLKDEQTDPTAPEANRRFYAMVDYFESIGKTFASAGNPYRIGVYGDGFVCDYLQKDGKAELCWLSQSLGFAGTAEAIANGAYHLRQINLKREYGEPHPSGECAGLGVDYNIARSGVEDFGQFRDYAER